MPNSYLTSEDLLHIFLLFSLELKFNPRLPGVVELSDSFSGYKTLWSTLNPAPVWTQACIDVGHTIDNVVLVFILECSSLSQDCYAAIDDVSVNTTHKCSGRFTNGLTQAFFVCIVALNLAVACILSSFFSPIFGNWMYLQLNRPMSRNYQFSGHLQLVWSRIFVDPQQYSILPASRYDRFSHF